MTVTVGMTKDIVEVCHQLMQERDTLETHNDLLVQAIDAVTAERDEARDWARRMMKERDEAREALRKEICKVNYTFRLGVIDPSKVRRWWIK